MLWGATEYGEVPGENVRVTVMVLLAVSTVTPEELALRVAVKLNWLEAFPAGQPQSPVKL